MTAREFADGYSICEKKILSRKRRIQERRESLFSLSQQVTERVQKSRSVDGAQRMLDTCMDDEKRLLAEIAALREEQRRIRKTLLALADEEQREVLGYRYMQGMAWREIAEHMHYAERQIYRLHGKALEKLAETLYISEALK